MGFVVFKIVCPSSVRWFSLEVLREDGIDGVFGLTKGSLLSSKPKNPCPGKQSKKLSLFPHGTSYKRRSAMDSTKSAWPEVFLLSEGCTLHQEKGMEQRHIKPTVFKCSSEITN